MGWKGLLLPISLLAGLLVLLVPLPGPLMDFLLAANITVSVLILLATIQIRTPMEFYAFPTVLLATTLFRLVMNIATTRLILTRAPDPRYGLDAAGIVVRQFGQFVAADQLVVGIVIFGIILVVQFVVITHGTNRVSEVAARFTLDSLPGRQMAIDADLQAGSIKDTEAKQRRRELQLQADFYGAMDGATKFVRGDAVAGLVITAINIGGGLILGLSRGMPLADALQVFTRLTIGDGLVTQVPALLTSVATAILVTRTSQASHLSLDFVNQILSSRTTLLIGSVFVAMLALLKLPVLPLLALASGCLLLAWQQPAAGAPSRGDLPEPHADASPTSKSPAATSPANHLNWDPLEIQLGAGLVALADPRQGGDLLQQISAVREQVTSDLGMLVPKVRVRDSNQLTQRSYVIHLGGVPIAEGTIFMERLLAVALPGRRLTLPGRRVEELVYGGMAVWIEPSQAAQARQMGCELLSPSAAIARHLRTVVRKHSHELINRDVTRALVESLRPHAPAVVEEVLAGGISLGQIQQVLRNLVAEDVPLRQLATILEALIDLVPHELPVSQWTEAVRRRLARSICLRYRASDGVLYHVALDVELDAYLQERTVWDENDYVMRITDDNQSRLKNLLEAQVEKLRANGTPPVVVVSPAVRRGFRRWSSQYLPDLIVLSTAELLPEMPHHAVGIVRTADLRPRHGPGTPDSRAVELANVT